MADAQIPRRSLLERVLGVVTDVRAGEGPLTLVLATNLFLLLTAYYFIKPVREGLILKMGSGAEYKSYMGAAIACALLLVIPAYGKLVDRLPRLRLVVGVTLFFASHLVLFYAASRIEWLRPRIGLIFFVWVGIFNLMVVAQLWSFANDLFRSEQGKRLFPLVAFGAALGSVLGSKIASLVTDPLKGKAAAGNALAKAPESEGIYTLLLMSAGVLAACAFLFVLAERLSQKLKTDAAGTGERSKDRPKSTEPPAASEGAFELIRKHPYLLAIALFTLVLNFANTNGEYMLGKLVQAAAADAVKHGEVAAADVGDFIGHAFSEFFFGVNVLTLIVQTFLVSRIVKYGGLAVALFALPIITLGSGLAVAAVPLLAVIRVGKTFENATDYSLNNTARQMLWLPTSRAMKYKAKQAVDTFFVRLGDVCSALLVYVGSQVFSWPIRGFAAVNVVLAALWIVIVVRIVRENKKFEPEQPPAAAAAAA
jgi:ATP:ADP antiporter, AAA family